MPFLTYSRSHSWKDFCVGIINYPENLIARCPPTHSYTKALTQLGSEKVNLKQNIYNLCVQVFCLSVCLCLVALEARGECGPGHIEGCELPCGCWKLNASPLEEQLVL